MNGPTIFELNPSSVLSANVWKLHNQSEARNVRSSVEHDQKLIKPKEASNELAHQIWIQSDQQFVYKCTALLNQSEPWEWQEFSGA